MSAVSLDRNARVLVVADDGERARAIGTLLAQGGLDDTVPSAEPTRVAELCEAHRPDLIVLEASAFRHALEHRATEREHEVENAQMEALQHLAAAAELRDDDTGLHTKRVGEISARLAAKLGLPPNEVELVRRAAPLHDVGKIGIPDGILRKPGRLTPAEHEAMKAHTVIGARILANGRSAAVQMAERIARSHHERWDGTGYPDGLSGERIPIEARIVAVADVLDALSHARPYRAAWSPEHVAALIRDGRGTHFDPAVVDALLGDTSAATSGEPAEATVGEETEKH